MEHGDAGAGSGDGVHGSGGDGDRRALQRTGAGAINVAAGGRGARGGPRRGSEWPGGDAEEDPGRGAGTSGHSGGGGRQGGEGVRGAELGHSRGLQGRDLD